MIDGLMVVDAHSHIKRPAKAGVDPFGQSYEQWLERMDECGIDKALVMCGTKLDPDEQKDQTSYVIEAVKQHSQKFFGQICVSPVWGKKAFEMMDWAEDNGLRGLKLCSHSQGCYAMDDPIVDPLVETAAKKGWWVMIHTDFTSPFCSPLLAIHLAKRFPSVTFILSHMGLHPDYILPTIDYAASVENVYLDTSATPNMVQFVYKMAVEKLHGRLLFGSDAPVLSPELELAKIKLAEKRFGLTLEEKELILSTNARRIFDC